MNKADRDRQLGTIRGREKSMEEEEGCCLMFMILMGILFVVGPIIFFITNWN